MRLAIKLVAAAALVAATAGTASALSAQQCADGYKGVIVENNGHYTSVCTNLIG
jgi:hypothetical protein